MPIIVQLPSGERREIGQDSILIGRGIHCALSLPGENQLREEHAQIRKIANRWIVESRGDWLIQVGNDAPAKFSWLKVGDVVRLTQSGPELVFEPAHEDVVLAGLENQAVEEPETASLPDLPTQVSTFRAMPPPLPAQVASRSMPPPLPGQASSTSPMPPPIPSYTVPNAIPPPLPGEQTKNRSMPPPLPRGDRGE